MRLWEREGFREMHVSKKSWKQVMKIKAMCQRRTWRVFLLGIEGKRACHGSAWPINKMPQNGAGR